MYICQIALVKLNLSKFNTNGIRNIYPIVIGQFKNVKNQEKWDNYVIYVNLKTSEIMRIAQ